MRLLAAAEECGHQPSRMAWLDLWIGFSRTKNAGISHLAMRLIKSLGPHAGNAEPPLSEAEMKELRRRTVTDSFLSRLLTV